MKIILVDAVNALVLKDEGIFNEMYKILESYWIYFILYFFNKKIKDVKQRFVKRLLLIISVFVLS